MTFRELFYFENDHCWISCFNTRLPAYSTSVLWYSCLCMKWSENCVLESAWRIWSYLEILLGHTDKLPFLLLSVFLLHRLFIYSLACFQECARHWGKTESRTCKYMCKNGVSWECDQRDYNAVRVCQHTCLQICTQRCDNLENEGIPRENQDEVSFQQCGEFLKKDL